MRSRKISEKVRICHFIDHLDGGGGQACIFNLVDGSDDNQFSHSVCYLKEKDIHTSLRPKFEDADIPVKCFHAKSYSLGTVLKSMIRYFRRNRFDILHTHTVYAQILARVFRPFLKIDHLISTYHMMPSSTYQNWYIKYLERMTRRIDDRKIAVSNGVKEAFQGRAPTAWQTIYNGIDVERYNTGAKNADFPDMPFDPMAGLNFVNIGRFVPEKSQSDLIFAMEEVVQSLPESNLVIIGGGELRDELRELAVDRGIDGKVHLIDHVSSVIEFYALADAFVFSSLEEGLPLVVLEAMAAGLPVVATDIPGVNEVVLDGVTGFLVPPNTPSSLAKRMIELRLHNLRDTLGSNAYRSVAHRYDLDTMVTEYQNLYRQLALD